MCHTYFQGVKKIIISYQKLQVSHVCQKKLPKKYVYKICKLSFEQIFEKNFSTIKQQTQDKNKRRAEIETRDPVSFNW